MLPSSLYMQKCMHTYTHAPRVKEEYNRSLNVIFEGKKSNYGSIYSEPTQLREDKGRKLRETWKYHLLHVITCIVWACAKNQ